MLYNLMYYFKIKKEFVLKDYIANYINDSISAKEKMLSSIEHLSLIDDAVNIIVIAYKNGNKVLTAGNGGSAGDAQHLAAEFVSKFFAERPALSAIALTTNTSILTSVGNDYDHKHVFARQLQAHAKEGDVFIAISTSPYMKGNCCLNGEGTPKRSKQDNNVWSPDTNPEFWEDV